MSDERIEALTQLRNTLSKSDPAALFNVVNELSVVGVFFLRFSVRKTDFKVIYHI